MNTNTDKDRRLNDRAVFKPEDNFFGTFTFQETPADKYLVRVMNISYTGVGFAIERQNKTGIEKNKMLVFHEMKVSSDHLLRLPKTLIQIVWVLDHDFLDYIGFGCDFKDLDAEIPGKIFTFIDGAFPNRLSPP